MDPTLVNGKGLDLRGIEFGYTTPYTQGYNLTLQYEFLPNNSFEIGYVATLARHLETFTGSNNPSRSCLPAPTGQLMFLGLTSGGASPTPDVCHQQLSFPCSRSTRTDSARASTCCSPTHSPRP